MRSVWELPNEEGADGQLLNFGRTESGWDLVCIGVCTGRQDAGFMSICIVDGKKRG